MNKRMLDRGLLGIIYLIALVGMIMMLAVLWEVVRRGWPALSLEFLLQPSSNFGAEGGLLYQTLGTIILMAAAVLIGFPIAVGSALFQTEYVRSEGVRAFFRAIIFSLNAVPTILFGLAGYLFFGVYLETGVSWLTGALILAIMILPTIQASIQSSIECLPEKYREVGMSLGMTPWALARRIVLPQCWHGAITGALLGLARAAGETAAIMFTAAAFSGATWPRSFADPVPTLQTHILVLAQDSADATSLTHAWGAALVLLAIVFFLILTSLVIRSRFSMEAQR